MIWGNHDIYKSSGKFNRNNLYQFHNPLTNKTEPLFKDIKVREGLILRYKNTPNRIFTVHGHQGDLFNDHLWPLSCFLVRRVWRRMEHMGARNPLSPSINSRRMVRSHREMMDWVGRKRQMMFAGHTHHSRFPEPGDIPYFNCGCCTYADGITGIEISDGEVMLVKWYRTTGSDGHPQFNKKILAGPEKLEDYFTDIF